MRWHATKKRSPPRDEQWNSTHSHLQTSRTKEGFFTALVSMKTRSRYTSRLLNWIPVIFRPSVALLRLTSNWGNLTKLSPLCRNYCSTRQTVGSACGRWRGSMLAWAGGVKRLRSCARSKGMAHSVATNSRSRPFIPRWAIATMPSPRSSEECSGVRCWRLFSRTLNLTRYARTRASNSCCVMLAFLLDSQRIETDVLSAVASAPIQGMAFYSVDGTLALPHDDR